MDMKIYTGGGVHWGISVLFCASSLLSIVHALVPPRCPGRGGGGTRMVGGRGGAVGIFFLYGLGGTGGPFFFVFCVFERFGETGGNLAESECSVPVRKSKKSTHGSSFQTIVSYSGFNRFT